MSLFERIRQDNIDSYLNAYNPKLSLKPMKRISASEQVGYLESGVTSTTMGIELSGYDYEGFMKYILGKWYPKTNNESEDKMYLDKKFNVLSGKYDKDDGSMCEVIGYFETEKEAKKFIKKQLEEDKNMDKFFSYYIEELNITKRFALEKPEIDMIEEEYK